MSQLIRRILHKLFPPIQGLRIVGHARVELKGLSFLNVKASSFGSPTLGALSSPDDLSILALGESSHLTLDHATIGRGSRIQVFGGAHLRIGKSSYIADNSFLSVSQEVSIGSNCAISWRVEIIDDDGHSIQGRDSRAPVSIGDHVWIGTGSRILKGSRIGNGCVVAAGSVVRGVFPENCLIGGVPAKILRENISWGERSSPHVAR